MLSQLAASCRRFAAAGSMPFCLSRPVVEKPKSRVQGQASKYEDAKDEQDNRDSNLPALITMQSCAACALILNFHHDSKARL